MNNPKFRDKDNKFNSEYYQFREYLRTNTHTCTMTCDALGIPQKNATRYKRILEDAGQLIEVFKTKCKNTGFVAAYLSTNKAIIQSIERERQRQLKLF